MESPTYEFSEAENRTIKTLASRMKWVGLFLLVGIWTTSAAKSFALIAQTSRSDAANLMNVLMMRLEFPARV